MSGKKILDGLRAAVDGNFSAVTIEGQRWVLAPPWMPIETAPKNGLSFLAVMAGPAAAEDCAWWVLYWNGHDFECMSSGNLILTDTKIAGAATHWQPLPEPPVPA